MINFYLVLFIYFFCDLKILLDILRKLLILFEKPFLIILEGKISYVVLIGIISIIDIA